MHKGNTSANKEADFTGPAAVLEELLTFYVDIKDALLLILISKFQQYFSSQSDTTSN